MSVHRVFFTVQLNKYLGVYTDVSDELILHKLKENYGKRFLGRAMERGCL